MQLGYYPVGYLELYHRQEIFQLFLKTNVNNCSYIFEIFSFMQILQNIFLGDKPIYVLK